MIFLTVQECLRFIDHIDGEIRRSTTGVSELRKTGRLMKRKLKHFINTGENLIE